MADLPPRNWHFFLECKDCGTQFQVLDRGIDASKELLPHNTRVFIVYTPQQCPKCQNLKVVEGDQNR